MSQSNSCYCGNKDCASVGRCLGSPLSPISWVTSYIPSKPITTLDDDDVLRIAKKVVELLGKSQPIEQGEDKKP